MKKAVKIINIIMILIAIIISVNTVVLATATVGVTDPSDLTGEAVEGTSKINSLGNKIITILTTTGSVVAVIVVVVLGLKYMMGSAEEKAEYKKTLIPYLVGAVLIFAASTIAGAIYSFTKDI